MANVQYNDLLDAGVHFGHLTRKWDPRMAPYIFMERNGIHIIDLNKTLACLEEASNAIKHVVRSGRKIMFVATKKQAKDIVAQEAQRLNMPYVTERWLGGMLTNFSTIRKSLKKLSTIDKMMREDDYKNLAKRERLMVTREKAKLEKILGGIVDLTRLPAALFVVDIKREHIAIKEAHKLNIPVFAMVDTNSDPNQVDFPIPSNDDAFKAVSLIVTLFSKAVEEGLMERKKEKEDAKLKQEEAKKRKMDEGKEVEEDTPAKEDAKVEKEEAKAVEPAQEEVKAEEMAVEEPAKEEVKAEEKAVEPAKEVKAEKVEQEKKPVEEAKEETSK